MQNTLHTGELRPKGNSIATFFVRNATTLVQIIGGLFILLFVYTALNKLTDLQQFQTVLKESPLVKQYSSLVAIGIPAIELLISLLLFLPQTRQLGLYLSFGLMTIFTLYLIYMVFFTPDLPCSCGGVIQKLSWGQHIAFNSFFVFLAAAGIWLNKKINND